MRVRIRQAHTMFISASWEIVLLLCFGFDFDFNVFSLFLLCFARVLLLLRLNLDFVVVARVWQEFQFLEFRIRANSIRIDSLISCTQSFYFIHGAGKEGEKEKDRVGMEWLWIHARGCCCCFVFKSNPRSEIATNFARWIDFENWTKTKSKTHFFATDEYLICRKYGLFIVIY